MTHEETIQKLMEMRLLGMVALLREWLLGPPTHGLTFEEQLAFLVDREWSDRHNRITARRLRDARLPVRATLEDVWCKPGRGIDRAVVRSFATGQWIRAKQNIIAVGRTGVGKSYLSAASPRPRAASASGHSVREHRAWCRSSGSHAPTGATPP